jgi:dGTPase
VRIVDRVAYINHDIDDAIRAGILAAEDLPQEELRVLGATGSRRIDTLVHDLVESSAEAGEIVQSEEIGGAMLSLRAFMFERVYLGPRSAEEHADVRATIRRIYEHLVDERGDDPEQATDYLAGMTDRFALSFAGQLA